MGVGLCQYDVWSRPSMDWELNSISLYVTSKQTTSIFRGAYHFLSMGESRGKKCQAPFDVAHDRELEHVWPIFGAYLAWIGD